MYTECIPETIYLQKSDTISSKKIRFPTYKIVLYRFVIISKRNSLFENRDDSGDVEILTELKFKLKKECLKKTLATQGFHYDAKEIFERVTKTVDKVSERLLEQSKATIAAIENVL